VINIYLEKSGRYFWNKTFILNFKKPNNMKYNKVIQQQQRFSYKNA